MINLNIHKSPAFERWAPFVARLMLSATFLMSAVGKIPGTEMFKMEVEMSGVAGLPFPAVMITLALILEVITCVMLIIGWHVRTAAILLAGFTFLIALTFVRDLSDQMQMTIFFSCMNLIAGLFYVAVYGAKSIAIKPD